jgi:hypothetical protein
VISFFIADLAFWGKGYKGTEVPEVPEVSKDAKDAKGARVTNAAKVSGELANS